MAVFVCVTVIILAPGVVQVISVDAGVVNESVPPVTLQLEVTPAGTFTV